MWMIAAINDAELKEETPGQLMWMIAAINDAVVGYYDALAAANIDKKVR